MWQVSVYSSGQHEQFRALGDRFALVRSSAARVRWQFHEGDHAPCSDAVLRMRIRGNALVVHGANVHSPLELAHGGKFWAAVPAELPLPCLFRLDEAWIEIRAETIDAAVLRLEPLHRAAVLANKPTTTSQLHGPDAETVAKWLSAVGQLHRTAASSPEFFNVAARLAVDSTGLDGAMILTQSDDYGWQIAGSALIDPSHGISFDPAVLHILAERPEVWRRPTPLAEPRDDRSRDDSPESIVVAPVKNDAGALIAAVYGVRHSRGDNRRRGIRSLEARVVELLAEAVSVGMARRQQEIESARQQVLLEQVFPPSVVEELRRHPETLAVRTRPVTMLFADLRRFTALAEGLAPAVAYELLAAVMEMLTQAVMDRGGVVIDYYGDGLSALWNAPLEQPNHADLACGAAMQMLEAMPVLGREWRSVLNQPLELGVGLHTGDVQVGNAGSRRRLKYGPRGAAVNVAARVEAATKHLEVPLLLTDAVRRQLSSQFVTLKICSAKLPGIEQPLDLFTAFPSIDGPRLQGDLERYASALSAFEAGDLDAAEQTLTGLLTDGAATPAAFLAQQAAALRRGALGRRVSDELICTPEAVIEILTK